MFLFYSAFLVMDDMPIEGRILSGHSGRRLGLGFMVSDGMDQDGLG